MKVLQSIVLCLAGSLAISIPAARVLAQTGYSITGGMSNFDVVNHCDEPCNEFECEIEGIHPEDVVHTYANGNYGAPTVTLSSSGTSTIIDYRNPQHLTAVGSIEHYGISLRSLSAAGAIRVRWMVGGRSATVNGHVPVAGGGSAPASQPIMPAITADMGTGSLGQDGVTCTVINNDTTQAIWIKRRAQVTQGVVTLEALMPNNAVVTTTVLIDAAPIFVGPGQSVSYTSDLIEIEDNQSAVFAAEYFQDLTQSGPFNNTHTVGPMLGNVMTASITSPGTGCDMSSPVILVQPLNTNAAAGHSVDLRVDADGNDLTLSYQWMKEGVPLTNNSMYSGVTSDGLSIDSLSADTEGFYSCKVSNTCGFAISQSALVFITGHNLPPARPSDGACCDPASGACTMTIQSACASGGAWDSTITCSPSPCLVGPTGACCDTTTGTCTVTAQSACTAPGAWLDSFPCASGLCILFVPGSCCDLMTGACTTLSPIDCSSSTTSSFTGGACTPSPCSQPTLGACCDSGACQMSSDLLCASTFLGANSTCGPASCCPSDFDDSGTLAVSDIFSYLNAWFAGDPRCDTDGDGVAIADIFNFLNSWFNGC